MSICCRESELQTPTDFIYHRMIWANQPDSFICFTIGMKCKEKDHPLLKKENLLAGSKDES